MGIKRIVDVSFWTDGKVDDFSPEDKYFMLYLLTCPFTTQLGIYEISIKQAAFQMGYSVDAVNVLLDRFENKYGMIRYSKETHEVAIKNYLRHSIVKGGAPVRDCLIKEIKSVKDKDLLAWVFSYVKGFENLNETVKNLIAEYEEKNGILYYCNEKSNDNKNVNDNENDNEVSYHDTNNDTLNESLKPKKKSKKETPHALFHRLLPDYLIPDALQAKISEWITYKAERKESYQEQGLKTLLRRLENSRIEYGEQAVMDLIDESMSNGWKGIIFDRLQQKQPQKTYRTPGRTVNTAIPPGSDQDDLDGLF